jgi:hypothetical protein
MKWERNIDRVGWRKVIHRVLVGKPEAKGPLGRPSLRWDFQEVGRECVDWIDLAQGRDS